jgi:hypothetical protein
MSKLIIFHGDKGGVGKSFAATMYLDREIAAGRSPVVIDSDVRNPDVIRVFQDDLECHQQKLINQKGWVDLYNLIETKTDQDVVISLPSQVGIFVSNEGDQLGDMTKIMDKKLVIVWPINTEADSVYLLKLALDEITKIDHLLVLMNGYFGDADTFDEWSGSKTRKAILDKGYSEGYIPKLYDPLSKKIRKSYKPFTKALKEGKITLVERVMIEGWIKKSYGVFEPLDAI